MRSRSLAKLKSQARLDLFARQHRCSPTPSEARLWSALNARQLGLSFRRQVPLAGFIADFYAPAVKLVVEVDGAIHSRKPGADARRDLKLRGAGLRVVRVGAELVLSNLPAAIGSSAPRSSRGSLGPDKVTGREVRTATGASAAH